MVEYGALPIGGTLYICPVKSVTLAKLSTGDPSDAATLFQTQLNDVAFTDYHLFRAESRILPATDRSGEEPSTPR